MPLARAHTTRVDLNPLGFGPSAISAVSGAYAQKSPRAGGAEAGPTGDAGACYKPRSRADRATSQGLRCMTGSTRPPLSGRAASCTSPASLSRPLAFMGAWGPGPGKAWTPRRECETCPQEIAGFASPTRADSHRVVDFRSQRSCRHRCARCWPPAGLRRRRRWSLRARCVPGSAQQEAGVFSPGTVRFAGSRAEGITSPGRMLIP